MADEQRVNIYGHDLDLDDLNDEHGVVVDVIVMARAIQYDENGHAEDTMLFATTGPTTATVQLGMIHHATTLLESEVRRTH